MRAFGLRLNSALEKYLFVLTPVSLILGFLFSRDLIGSGAAISWLFAYMTFVMATGCSWRQICDVFRMPGPLLLTFLLAHAAAPAAAYALGAAVFGPDSPYTVGFVLFAIIPLGVSSIIWVSLSGGHVPFALAVIVLDTVISPLVIPGGLALFFGTSLSFDHTKLMTDLVKVIVLPTMAGVAVNAWSKQRFKTWSAPVTGFTSKLALFAIVMINAAVIQPYVTEMKADMPLIVPLVALLIFLCYATGFAGSLWLKRTEVIVAVTYSAGMRNISMGLVLALGYFDPRTAVPVVLSILIQQPFATISHWAMKKGMRTPLYKKLTGAPQPQEVR